MSDDGITASADKFIILEAARRCAEHHKAEASRKNKEQLAAWAEKEIGWTWNRHKRGMKAALKIQKECWYLNGSCNTSCAIRADEIINIVSAPDLTDVRLTESDLKLLRDFLTG